MYKGGNRNYRKFVQTIFLMKKYTDTILLFCSEIVLYMDTIKSYNLIVVINVYIILGGTIQC